MKRALLLEPDNIKSRYNFACMLAAQLKETGAVLELLEPVFEIAPAVFLTTQRPIRTSTLCGMSRS
jgi:hypothetical protein